MRRLKLISGLILFAGLVVVLLTACPGRNETTEPGPGGLPRGIVNEGEPQAAEVEFPLYPGATRRATGVYETTDPIVTVRDYYIDLLRIQPVTRDEDREVFTFVTAEYTLVLIPIPGSPGGTEIDFEVLDDEEEEEE